MGASMLSAAQLRGPDVFAPYLWWDFTQRHDLPPDSTYTRASTKYQWNPNTGLYEPYASNTYAPDYNPLTGAQRGFRSETAATNLLLWSADFSNAAWAVTNASKASASGSLISAGTAQTITQTGAGGYVAQTVGTYSGSTETVSVLVEQGSGAVVTRILMRNTTDSTDVGYVDLTWSTGGVVASGSGTAFAASRRTSGPNGGTCYLVALTGFTATAGKTRQVRVIPDTTASNAVVYAHHAQLVAGTRVSSPIVTGAASAARQADVMSILTLPAWFNQAQYTMFAEVELEQAHTVYGGALGINDGTPSNRNWFRISPTVASYLVNTGGVNQVATSVTTTSVGIGKLAASCVANSFMYARNGVAATADTSGSMPTVSRVGIGSEEAGTQQLDGWIRRIGIAPVTQTTAQLQALTA